MDIIPAIDILDGRCVRLYQGDYKQSQIYSENPVEIAHRWADLGATCLHLVDLDGAKQGTPVNLTTIESIVKSVAIPVQVGGGLRSSPSIAQLLALGASTAIVGTIAVEAPTLVQELCQEFPGKIAVGIDARNGKVATRGWLKTSEILATDLAQQMVGFGATSIIYTDIHRDGTLVGPNCKALRELASHVEIPVIASGGVSSLTDLLGLLSLEALGVKGVIIGKALYTGNLNLAEALRAVGPGRWQDIPPNLESSALG
ncbi:1-(5-phosphoribosyl)-5-[(5-phosphoribosylamino)methylideneamino]imidazole-4-carboxamide isomerase [Cyanobacterium sp. uoEpiScrs1]|uniref:1-(5-phosphoribosyl)-5-[(5- phosphoribosylamino)methylideneamino]imidazole-4- carboxamide isomerase n=1 Tax=Cyanobacterium sp. uoEpiScrs1 TaxID=2976343 RepID=UPI002269D2CE|nr:1-(5-phosphoribosyl)-5-[(5-phosphoribosylamino)methylideneamino]imidazole-4-carboxamide isomerase [Cyanobacterium sp. uoEpiScrs1]